MAYYPDLGACDYFVGDSDAPLLAVGWLEFGRPVPTGQVSEQALERLQALLRDPWGPLFLGVHVCDFCIRSYGPIQLGSFPHALGRTNVFVPGDAKVYVAPELILHYIDEYGYAPPTEFEQAVLACPRMGSPEYLQAISGLGLAGAVAERAYFEATIGTQLSQLRLFAGAHDVARELRVNAVGVEFMRRREEGDARIPAEAEFVSFFHWRNRKNDMAGLRNENPELWHELETAYAALDVARHGFADPPGSDDLLRLADRLDKATEAE